MIFYKLVFVNFEFDQINRNNFNEMTRRPTLLLQKWIPTYGYKKSAADREKDWLIEVPKNIDPSTDMFAEKNRFKKENIAKNEYQRLRNIAAGRKMKVPEFGVPPLEGNMHQTQVSEVTRRCTIRHYHLLEISMHNSCFDATFCYKPVFDCLSYEPPLS